MYTYLPDILTFILGFNPLESKVFLGSLRRFYIFVIFSVAYKHINGTGAITLNLAQTGLP